MSVPTAIHQVNRNLDCQDDEAHPYCAESLADSAIVVAKPANKAGQLAAEPVDNEDDAGDWAGFDSTHSPDRPERSLTVALLK